VDTELIAYFADCENYSENSGSGSRMQNMTAVFCKCFVFVLQVVCNFSNIILCHNLYAANNKLALHCKFIT